MNTPFYCSICGLKLKELNDGGGELYCKNGHIWRVSTWSNTCYDMLLVMKQTFEPSIATASGAKKEVTTNERS
jgi:hypothetical protein